MDLRQFYLDNVTEGEYYYKFFDLIKDINYTYNVFNGWQETEDYNFFIDDIEAAIDKFKSICQPENENPNKEDSCWFYLILFYLHKSGFSIEEFPKLIERPPVEPYDFINKSVRNRLISEKKDDGGTVRWSTRRSLVADLNFVQKEAYIELGDAIENKFKEISNRQAMFQSMSMDEKLAEISNLIENLLKVNGKFIPLNYPSVCFDYVDEETIKKYRKKLHCFRHSSPDAIAEREALSRDQKTFLIDFGLTIVKVIHALINKSVKRE